MIVLGHGAFGRVYLARSLKDASKYVVVKKIILSEQYTRIGIVGSDEILALPTEVIVHKSLKEQVKGTPKLLHWGYDRRDDTAMMVYRYHESYITLIEYMNGEALSEKECLKIMKEVVNVVCEMDRLGVHHGDLKFDNILYDPEAQKVLLVDLGSALFGSRRVQRCNVNCALYITTPECILNDVFTPEMLTVYQLGVLAYTLLHVDYPFDTIKDVCTKPITWKRKGRKFATELSEFARHFIKVTTKKHAEFRPSLKNLVNHPWLSL
jgi:serine/threonine protein kinase